MNLNLNGSRKFSFSLCFVSCSALEAVSDNPGVNNPLAPFTTTARAPGVVRH